MPHKKTHMKTNQDGGSYTAKKPGAAANELQSNQDGAAKMGYKQHFGGLEYRHLKWVMQKLAS
jgi:hypothetical protein